MEMSQILDNIKNKIMILFTALALLSPVPALAASTIPACDIPGSSGSSVCKDQNSAEANKNPIISIIKTAINVVSYMAGAAAVIAILISSIRFLTANGDENSIAGARRTLIFAGAGLIVVIIAQAIVAFALKQY